MRWRKQTIHTAVFYVFVIVLFLFGTFVGNSAVAVISETMPAERKNRIVIDAGHGGEDGGATSCSGILESNINLAIARKLDDLMHFLGYDTRMIRKSDISVYTKGDTIAQKKISDLRQRVRIANETPNAILISIHQNQYLEEKYKGAQVFYAETEGSIDLAKQLQNSFVQYLNPGSRREIKKGSGIYLLDKIHCTGVLVECGFISNFEEEQKLRSNEYQNKIACLIAAAVSSFSQDT